MPYESFSTDFNFWDYGPRAIRLYEIMTFSNNTSSLSLSRDCLRSCSGISFPRYNAFFSFLQCRLPRMFVFSVCTHNSEDYKNPRLRLFSDFDFTQSVFVQLGITRVGHGTGTPHRVVNLVIQLMKTTTTTVKYMSWALWATELCTCTKGSIWNEFKINRVPFIFPAYIYPITKQFGKWYGPTCFNSGCIIIPW